MSITLLLQLKIPKRNTTFKPLKYRKEQSSNCSNTDQKQEDPKWFFSPQIPWSQGRKSWSSEMCYRCSLEKSIPWSSDLYACVSYWYCRIQKWFCAETPEQLPFQGQSIMLPHILPLHPKKVWQEYPEVMPTAQAVAGHQFHLLKTIISATSWFNPSKLPARWCKLLETLPKEAHFWQTFNTFLIGSGLPPAPSGATQSMSDGLLNDITRKEGTNQTCHSAARTLFCVSSWTPKNQHAFTPTCWHSLTLWDRDLGWD